MTLHSELERRREDPDFFVQSNVTETELLVPTIPKRLGERRTEASKVECCKPTK